MEVGEVAKAGHLIGKRATFRYGAVIAKAEDTLTAQALPTAVVAKALEVGLV